MSYPKTRPEDQIPKGCSLHSMEPLREWFCKGADMTSAAESEAALVQLEEEPPDIRHYNANIREERWTNFSLEGVRFPAMTVDVIHQSQFSGRGCDEALFSEKKGFSVKRGQAIQ